MTMSPRFPASARRFRFNTGSTVFIVCGPPLSATIAG